MLPRSSHLMLAITIHSIAHAVNTEQCLPENGPFLWIVLNVPTGYCHPAVFLSWHSEIRRNQITVYRMKTKTQCQRSERNIPEVTVITCRWSWVICLGPWLWLCQDPFLQAVSITVWPAASHCPSCPNIIFNPSALVDNDSKFQDWSDKASPRWMLGSQTPFSTPGAADNRERSAARAKFKFSGPGFARLRPSRRMGSWQPILNLMSFICTSWLAFYLCANKYLPLLD